ncbi:tRNA-specific 2-thiouridylase MnmA [Dirofilaria immitis]
MSPSWMAVFIIYLADVVETACSMENLPKFEGEYIHYLLSWDCKLTITRNWDGSSLREFRIISDKLNICKSDGTGSPIHYVQIHSKAYQLPFLVFIIHFHKENDTNSNLWRVIRINITEITYQKRLHRTILDSILTEYSILYTNYPLRTCTYHTMSSIYCFWQKGIEQWAQLYNMSGIATALEYRAAGEAFYLEGHSNFGEIIGSLPGSIPRVLMFDYKVPGWLYEVPMSTNLTMPGRRIQEMRKIGKVEGKLEQVAAMSIQSFIISDCHDSVCEYRHNSLSQIAKAITTCVFTSSFDAVSGIFEMPRNFLIPIKPELEATPSSQIIRLSTSSLTKKRREISIKQWIEYCMVAIYAFTVVLVLIMKLVVEILTLELLPIEDTKELFGGIGGIVSFSSGRIILGYIFDSLSHQY